MIRKKRITQPAWRRAATLAALTFTFPAPLQSQPCAALPRGERAAAVASAFAEIVAANSQAHRAPENFRVWRTVPAADDVVVVVTNSWLTHVLMVGLAGPDSVCYSGARAFPGGVWIDSAAVRQWNAALPRVARNLKVRSEKQARQLAASLLTFATGWPLDSILPVGPGCPKQSDTFTGATIAVHEVNGGWNVSGALLVGDSRLFFVRADSAGRVRTLFIQDPGDPPCWQ